MKLLVAESSTTVGGQELAVALHAEGLLKRGYELRLIVEPESPICEMASSKGIPVVAMFGPTSAGRTGPYGVGHRVLTGHVPCSPCFSRVCRHSPEMECLHFIKPNAVVEAVRHLLIAHTISR